MTVRVRASALRKIDPSSCPHPLPGCPLNLAHRSLHAAFWSLFGLICEPPQLTESLSMLSLKASVSPSLSQVHFLLSLLSPALRRTAVIRYSCAIVIQTCQAARSPRTRGPETTHSSPFQGVICRSKRYHASSYDAMTHRNAVCSSYASSG